MFVDNLKQVVTSSDGDPISLQLTASNSVYTPRYDAGNSLWSEMGVFNLTEVVFIGEPGSDVTLFISSSFIDSSLSLVDPNYNLSATISFRGCVSGEEYTSDG